MISLGIGRSTEGERGVLYSLLERCTPGSFSHYSRSIPEYSVCQDAARRRRLHASTQDSSE